METTVKCCICDTPLSPPYPTINGRVYCHRHFAMVNKPNNGVWRAGLFQIIMMGLLSALFASAATLIGPLSYTALIVVDLVLAVVPSALWIVYFYRQDRLEPEPKTRVLAVFLLAMLLQLAIGQRLSDDWFQVPRWATGTITSLLASVLIIGVVWQAIAYAAVRLVVYNTPEFDERMDGIVYGTVAGLGVATLVNFQYVLANQGVSLAAGVIQMTTMALAQASFGGLMGYFMAQAKFEHRPGWWVPFGFALTAVLNGVCSWLINEVSTSGLGVNLWRSLVLGLLVALVTFAVLVALMRRVTEVTLTQNKRSV